MDPQKNASNPAPFNDGQVPLSAQDDGTGAAPVAPTTAPTSDSQEVTVDFSQGQQATPVDSSQAGGVNNMPSITPEAPMPPINATPAMPGQPADAFGAPQATAPQAQQPADQFDQFSQPGQPAQPGQPGAFPSPGVPDAAPGTASAPQDFFGAAPAQPGQPTGNPADPAASGFGQPQPSAQPQSAVPPVAPVPVSAKNDKKTVLILAGVAVILIVAIAVLVLS